jgi:hypothetical protein
MVVANKYKERKTKTKKKKKTGCVCGPGTIALLVSGNGKQTGGRCLWWLREGDYRN